MEIVTKYRESVLNHQPVLLKPKLIEDELAFESLSSKGFFQDLHQFDQFLPNGPLLNPELNVQTMSMDPLDPLPSSHGCPTDLTFYELKPFADQNGGNSAAMQSLQGDAYWNPRKTIIDMIPPDQTRSVPLNYCQDIKSPTNFVMPDESSCITAENGYYKQVRIKKNTASGFTEKPCKGRRKSNSIKGQWTVEEDRHLIHLVEKYGMRKWSHIAQMLKGRIGKQCRERWHNHLRPDIKKDVWSEEEDKILIQAHAEVGNKWAEIAKRLPGRTENSIKNHWNATKRRQYSRRRCRSKYPRPSSLLQNYIQSLNLDGKDSSNGKIDSSGDGLKVDEMMEASTQAAAETLELNATTTEWLVPNYEFNKEVSGADFAFDANLFEESSIESLLDGLPCGAVGDEKCLDMEFMPLDTASLTQFEVKKEMDLVEMISHVNL